MNTCHICGRQVKRLSATQRVRYGLDLCFTCYRRIRSQHATPPRPADLRSTASLAVAAAQQAAGPPYCWPLCEFCGQDVDQHGLGTYTTKGKPRRFCCPSTATPAVTASAPPSAPPTGEPQSLTFPRRNAMIHHRPLAPILLTTGAKRPSDVDQEHDPHPCGQGCTCHP